MHTVVIGAGPAGAACALWLHQVGCPVLLLDKNPCAGGLQQFSPYENVWIPSVMGRRGEEVARNLEDHLRHSGVPMRLSAGVSKVTASRDGGFLLRCSDRCDHAASQVVLATGARFRAGGFTPSATLSVGPGKNFEAIDVGGRRVAVLGGGDNAFDAYLFAKRRKARECRIFARTLRAQRKLRAMVPAEDVHIGPVAVDALAPAVNSEPFDFISVQYGFEAVVPAGLEQLQRTAAGYVEADLWGLTSMDGVYAAGEVANTFHPCVTTSFAHGIQVAKHIQKRLGL